MLGLLIISLVVNGVYAVKECTYHDYHVVTTSDGNDYLYDSDVAFEEGETVSVLFNLNDIKDVTDDEIVYILNKKH